MPNNLNLYNPKFYAQEALIQLEKALGMAMRVHRGYDEERRSFRKGSTIDISQPGTFTAQNAPSTAQDIKPNNVTLTLDRWKEVKFKLTDKELAYTGEKIIQDHIRPAAYALADEVDQTLASLAEDIPWVINDQASPDIKDITEPRRIMVQNKVPVGGGDIHLMVDPVKEAGFFGLAAFNTQSVTGGVVNQDTLLRGHLGTRFGVEVFMNQNVALHTPGTISDLTPVTNGTFPKGSTSINIDDTSLTGTLTKGDTFVIAGHSQRYAVTGLVTASGNAMNTVGISPPLQVDVGDGVALTVDDNGDAVEVMNLMFHKNAFALAMAPLSELGNQLGAKIATITDPVTGLALRSRMFYDGNNSEVYVALDILYGVKTLDPNLAVRLRG